MKKHLKKIVFAVCLMVLTLTLASCGATPKFDLEKAAENLERRDYWVSYEEDYDDETAPQIKEYLSAHDGDQSITIIKFNDLRSAKLYYKIMKVEYETELKELKFELKAYRWERIRYAGKLDSDDMDDLEEEIEELKDEIDELKKEVSYGRIGNIVWVGTKEAVEDTK